MQKYDYIFNVVGGGRFGGGMRPKTRDHEGGLKGEEAGLEEWGHRLRLNLRTVINQAETHWNSVMS